MEIRQYIQENEARMLDELFGLIRIPSISALPQHKEDMERCAHRWCELLLQAGVQKAELMPSDGNPLVYAEYIVNPDDFLSKGKATPFEGMKLSGECKLTALNGQTVYKLKEN